MTLLSEQKAEKAKNLIDRILRSDNKNAEVQKIRDEAEEARIFIEAVEYLLNTDMIKDIISRK